MNKYLAAYNELNENNIAYHLDELGLTILPGKTYDKGMKILGKYGVYIWM